MEPPFQPFEPDGTNGGRGPRLREIPLRLMIPNLVTMLAICAGLSGIRLAFEGRFEIAVAMVLLAAFLDAMDGRVARRLKATSKFGAQMDSLADVVNFGVAPALVVYAYLLDIARSLGWISALVFVVAAALRLARFNVMAESPGKPKWQADYFIGIPAPAAAVLVMLPVYLGFLGFETGSVQAFVGALYTLLIAFLMVSQLPVYSGKSSSAKINRDWVVPVILLVVLYVLFLMTYTWETMTFSAIAYLVFLPFSAWMFRKRLEAENEQKPSESNGQG